MIDRGTWRILHTPHGDDLNFSYSAGLGLRPISAGDVTRTVRWAPGGLRMDISPDDDVYYVKIR